MHRGIRESYKACTLLHPQVITITVLIELKIHSCNTKQVVSQLRQHDAFLCADVIFTQHLTTSTRERLTFVLRSRL